MSQSTKLFVLLLFMFVIYTTMNGHLSEYIKLMLGKKKGQSSVLQFGAISAII